MKILASMILRLDNQSLFVDKPYLCIVSSAVIGQPCFADILGIE